MVLLLFKHVYHFDISLIFMVKEQVHQVCLFFFWGEECDFGIRTVDLVSC